MTSVFYDDISVFQQYTTQNVQEWFLEYENDSTELPGLSNTPDLNPIEHLGDMLGQQNSFAEPSPQNNL